VIVGIHSYASICSSALVDFTDGILCQHFDLWHWFLFFLKREDGYRQQLKLSGLIGET